MARLPRQRSSVEWYHVMNRGARKWPVFIDDGDRLDFLRLLGGMSERFEVEVHAYCLMGNHYHLLLRCPDGNLSEAMQYLSAVYTQRFNAKHGFDGPLFRGRFRSKPVEDDNYLIALARYIPRNPVEMTGQEGLDTYRWSSHRAYLGLERSPKWLVKQTVLALFENRIDRYGSFVASAFTPVSDEEITDGLEPKLASGLPLQTIETILAGNDGSISDAFVTSGPRVANEARLLLILIASEFGIASTSEIAERYGLNSDASVRSSIYRAKKRIALSGSFEALYATARADLVDALNHGNTNAA